MIDDRSNSVNWWWWRRRRGNTLWWTVLRAAPGSAGLARAAYAAGLFHGMPAATAGVAVGAPARWRGPAGEQAIRSTRRTVSTTGISDRHIVGASAAKSSCREASVPSADQLPSPSNITRMCCPPGGHDLEVQLGVVGPRGGGLHDAVGGTRGSRGSGRARVVPRFQKRRLSPACLQVGAVVVGPDLDRPVRGEARQLQRHDQRIPARRSRRRRGRASGRSSGRVGYGGPGPGACGSAGTLPARRARPGPPAPHRTAGPPLGAVVLDAAVFPDAAGVRGAGATAVVAAAEGNGDAVVPDGCSSPRRPRPEARPTAAGRPRRSCRRPPTSGRGCSTRPPQAAHDHPRRDDRGEPDHRDSDHVEELPPHSRPSCSGSPEPGLVARYVT